MEIALRVHVVVRHISSNITGCTESALCDHDGSVPYFPICQGTLPWQPNNIAVMKANCMANVDKLTVLSLDMFAKWWGCKALR